MEGTATCHKGPWAFELDPGSDVVPNNCPILLDNWREFLSFVSEQKKGAVYSAIRHIETELQASIGVTELFNIDHGRGHINRVTEVGLRFIDRLASFGLDDGSEKTKLMFKVAAAMHDIGLKPSNHAAKSSSMAKASVELGLHFNTFKKYAIQLGCYKPNQGGKGTSKPSAGKIPIEEVLNGNHPQYQTYKLNPL
jgi:hypothetical protein